jgi:branched-chain amino acid transport system permease protein
VSLFVNQLFNAILLGGVYALAAISMTFIYSVSKVVQLAQGDIIIFGAYVGFVTVTAVPNLLLGIVLGAIITGILGLLINDLIFRWIRNAGHFPLVAGIALSTIIEESLRLTFSEGHPITYPVSVAGEGAASVGLQLLILGTALVAGAGFQFFLSKTRHGRALRATADNPEMASLLGVSTGQMIRLSFIVGSALAGGAGVLLAIVLQYVDPFVGSDIEFVAIAIILFGGLGSIPGAVVGAFVLAMSQVFVATYIGGTLRDAATFGVILLIMLVRPQGLFGRAQTLRA